VSVIAFLTVMAVSLIYTPLFIAGFMELIRLSVLFALAYAMMICVNSRRKVAFVAWSYILIPLGVSIFTIYEIFTEGSFFASQVIRVATELGLNIFRSTGTFHNPNFLACFLMIGITITFGMLFVKNLNFLAKIFLVLCIGIISVALISSFSRGGWVSTFCAVVVLVILHKKWSYLGLFTGLLILVLLIVSIKFPEIILSTFGRLISIFDPTSEASSSSRLSLIKSGIWMWQDHPILGVGAGGFPYYAYDYLDPNMPLNLASVKEAHTLQVKILAEEGLIGITIALWFFFTVVFDGVRSIRMMKNDYLRNVQIGMIALFIGFLVNFTFASDILDNNFWITVGIIYAIPLVDRKYMNNHLPDIVA
jgi:O-antigen ligase